MKNTLAIILCLASFYSEAQISGKVIDSDGTLVNYATIFNLNNKIGCVTDSVGFFEMNGTSTDSIRIQHVSYQTGNFLASKNPDQYILHRNINNIDEIIVSKKYAAWLYFKSYEKAISKFPKERRDKMYCNAIKILNSDTLEKKLLDFDFEQKVVIDSSKTKIHNRFAEIQKKNELFNPDIDKFATNKLKIGIFPMNDFPRNLLAKNKKESMNDNYIFSISTNDHFITIDFIPKSNSPDYYLAVEAIISKSDTCLATYAIASYPTPVVNWKTKENKPDLTDHSIYFKIGYENGFSYLSEIYTCFNAYFNKDNKAFTYKYSINLKNYAHGIERQKDRFGTMYFDNSILFDEKPKSKYSEEFWKSSDFPKKAPYDFERLRKLKQHIF
ncbi:MAG: carboxypeptidase-like regulatory domain-containing protein [Paludibacter sp.]|nr:carboxypeptidase-like regulatory domain-containing protein [Paludibacter sp.]